MGISLVFVFDINKGIIDLKKMQFEMQQTAVEDDEETIKQIMSLIGSLGNRNKLSIKTAEGQMRIQLSIKPNQLVQNNKNSNNFVDEEVSEHTFIEEMAASQMTPVKDKKFSINLKNKTKKQKANEVLLNFINESQKKDTPLTKIASTKSVEETLTFLRQNHPEDREHLDLLTQHMAQLEQIKQDSTKQFQQISSILSSSFSSRIDPSSVDLSMLSVIGNVNSDPLCQLFSSYFKRTMTTQNSNHEKTPSFLFLYSQPMIDLKGNEIDDQINYFEEEGIIQKILKTCNINYIRERATINKFHYWMKQSVSIMHFCGHGVQSEQNYLLFQNINGQSVKMDSELLSKILNELPNPLKLVLVASCHSESTGRIFAEAGASHVICVKDNHRILDEICQEFVRIFYHSCINDKMKICQAYQFAKKQLRLNGKFTTHQCQKFTLLKNHSQSQCMCLDLNKGQSTKFNDLTPKPYYSQNMPSRVQNFIPRPKDLHQILKLIEGKRRFITIVGSAGIGKSTLARELVRYIQFRDFFRDGVIYNDIRNCENVDKLFESLNIEIFQNNGIKLNKTYQQNIQRLLKQLKDKQVLIVLDNCQSIISSNDREEFKKLIESIMKNCIEVYFVFTNRNTIGRQIDYCSEKLYELAKLNQHQSQRLFFQIAPRNIDKKELDQFFMMEQRQIGGKHEFFQFLNGHPEAICMTASLLSQRRLSDIYDLLMKPCINISDQLGKLQMGEKVNKVVETAMKISLNVLKNKHKQASEMIKLLSLLPRGLDSQMMAKIFGVKWKQTVNKLVHYSLVQQIDNYVVSKYYTVHPEIISYVQSEISNEEKIKFHERICQQFAKRIERIYKYIGTISQQSVKAQEIFLSEQINYQAIIYRQLSICGDSSRIRKLYGNLFKLDYIQDEDKKTSVDIRSNAVEATRKRMVYSQKILQPTKKEPIIFIIVYYTTILLVIKNMATCTRFIQYGIIISRKKNKLIIEANLLRISGCIDLLKNKMSEARESFFKSWQLFALEGCGLGSASCQAAVGYIRFMEEQYAMAKKNMESALKYYDQIPHAFGRHYLNRWLYSLKGKINRQENQRSSHREVAQKLFKQARINLRSLKSNNINNTELIKHKVGIFVFRFTFDNISLFLQASFEVDVRPKIINETVLKKNKDDKILQDFYGEEQQIFSSQASQAKEVNKEAYKKLIRKEK